MSFDDFNGIKLHILGTEYTLKVKAKEDDPLFETLDGYCDNTKKVIALMDLSKEKCWQGNTGDVKKAFNGIMRHEIVHAFLYESGLAVQCDFAKDEICVDWIALQAPKMFKLWQDLEVME